MFDLQNVRIGIVGLGYVGLPLAVEFGKKFPTVGFDLNQDRVAELRGGADSTLEVESDELATATHLSFTTDVSGLKDCNVYIVTVPTPVGQDKRPILTPLIRASDSLATVLSEGDVVVYESTVYPGATEEVCVPLLEAGSGLAVNINFFVGYSPERINPGDKAHRLPTILKVTSGSTPEAAERIDSLYASIITAGTHKASSIKVAEAAKVIENTQRDLNIALVNELAVIFDRVGIDTEEVLLAAGTKWNFLPFRPGLVGGHCIGVDPYYLTHKAEELGYNPEVILAGRRINDNMSKFVADKVLKLMLSREINPCTAKALVLGLTFKENCPDVRNTKVVDVVAELQAYGIAVDVYDPWVDKSEASQEYGIRPIEQPADGNYDAIILAVAHREFIELGGSGIRRYGQPNAVVYDIKSALPVADVDDRL